MQCMFIYVNISSSFDKTIEFTSAKKKHTSGYIFNVEHILKKRPLGHVLDTGIRSFGATRVSRNQVEQPVKAHF